MAWNPNVPTVTNRVQDDLDAIRQNFEALDGLPQDKTNILELAGEKDNILGHLADTNNPHNVQAQQVPYSSGVAGFTPADVKAALDALAGVRIVEMGSNSNGEYVRWENGLQICVHTGPTFSVDASTYVFYEWSQFPASFDEVWVVLGSSTTLGGSIASRLTRGTLGRSGDSYRVWMVNDSSESRSMIPHFLAVGRWK